MPIPLIGWAAAAVGAVVVGAVVNAFSDDDKSSTTTTSNREELEEEREEARIRHNEKIYKEIEAYKEKKLNEIKKDFGVEIQHKLNPIGVAIGGIISTPAIMALATVKATETALEIASTKSVSEVISKQISKLIKETSSEKVSLCAIFSNNNREIVFHGIDTSHIKKENENLQNEFNELKEFLDEIKNG